MRLSFRHGDLHTMAVYQSSTAQSPRPLVLTAGPRHTIQRSSAAFAVLAESTPVRLQGQSLAHCLAAIGAGRRVPLLDQVYLTRAPWILHDQEHAHPTCGAVCWTYTCWPILNDTEAVLGVLLEVHAPALPVPLGGATQQRVAASTATSGAAWRDSHR